MLFQTGSYNGWLIDCAGEGELVYGLTEHGAMMIEAEPCCQLAVFAGFARGCQAKRKRDGPARIPAAGGCPTISLLKNPQSATWGHVAYRNSAESCVP